MISALSLYLIGYLKIIFNFASLVKNNFQRLPRRAFGTARNDEFPAREVLSGCLKVLVEVLS
ncbi:MAG: hypothetical protein J6U05_08185 [Neisseriaceae bacterium]|nr:hypothetical protein [Neisseriaceae bacterium]